MYAIKCTCTEKDGSIKSLGLLMDFRNGGHNVVLFQNTKLAQKHIEVLRQASSSNMNFETIEVKEAVDNDSIGV